MYPLRFEPIFQRYLWGGRRLADVLQKPIGKETCAESWEIVDHNQHQSVVKFGDLSGKTLHELIVESGSELLGERILKQISDEGLPPELRNRFPLLLKFLDANKHLSVQVHPDDTYGATLDPPDLGKTEAWYVMHADEGSKIFAGLNADVTKESFRSAIENGETESTLSSFQPKAGDCVFIKAGTMHAIGAGLLIAEIQQASNTTFRVFDWNRVDKDGKPRDLHIEQSIETTNFDLGPVAPAVSSDTDFENAKTLVTDPKFVLRRWQIDHETKIKCEDSFHILAVINGSITVSNDPSGMPLTMGQTMLVPASQSSFTLSPNEKTELLDIYIPA